MRVLATLFMVVCGARPAVAQLSIAGDLAVQTRSIWRGLERTSRPAIVLSAFAAHERAVWSAVVGAYALSEPFGGDGAGATIAGDGGIAPGEVDVYAQVDAYLGRRFTATIGVTRYTFHGDAATGGRGSASNTTDVHLRAEADAGLMGLEPEIAVWADVDRVRGAFAEYSLRRRVPFFPTVVPPTFIAAVTSGWAYGQGGDAGDPDRGAYFTRSGYRYTDLSLTGTPLVRVAGLAVTIDASVHYLVGRRGDAAPGESRPLGRGWWTEIRIRAPAISRLEPGS